MSLRRSARRTQKSREVIEQAARSDARSSLDPGTDENESSPLLDITDEVDDIQDEEEEVSPENLVSEAEDEEEVDDPVEDPVEELPTLEPSPVIAPRVDRNQVRARQPTGSSPIDPSASPLVRPPTKRPRIMQNQPISILSSKNRVDKGKGRMRTLDFEDADNAFQNAFRTPNNLDNSAFITPAPMSMHNSSRNAFNSSRAHFADSVHDSGNIAKKSEPTYTMTQSQLNVLLATVARKTIAKSDERRRPQVEDEFDQSGEFSLSLCISDFWHFSASSAPLHNLRDLRILDSDIHGVVLGLSMTKVILLVFR